MNFFEWTVSSHLELKGGKIAWPRMGCSTERGQDSLAPNGLLQKGGKIAWPRMGCSTHHLAPNGLFHLNVQSVEIIRAKLRYLVDRIRAFGDPLVLVPSGEAVVRFFQAQDLIEKG